jgi:uncharacterized phage protein (TIGR01671 family)
MTQKTQLNSTRPILFRVWDIKNKQYLRTFSLDCVDVTGDLADFFKDEYIFEQYTGLKDKSGIMIYEGDILRFADDLLYSVNFGSFYDNYGNEIAATFFIRSLTNDFTAILEKRELSRMIITGNVLQNPKLICPSTTTT